MLRISPGTVQAFEAASAIGVRGRFIDWMETYSGTVGSFQRDVLAGAFESFAAEAAEAGIDTDKRRFLFTAALLLMPEITGPQYLLALDIVFTDGAASHGLERLVALAGKPNG